jgi:DNA-binding HxlR family transcriptional regulator
MLSSGGCPRNMLSIKDALDAVEGKWRLLILFTLASGPKRFSQIGAAIGGITDKTLSKELKILEEHQLVLREVSDDVPQKIEYSITEHGRSLERVMDELHYWGLLHRDQIMGKTRAAK